MKKARLCFLIACIAVGGAFLLFEKREAYLRKQKPAFAVDERDLDKRRLEQHARAIEIASKITKGMTLKQVSEVIPISTNGSWSVRRSGFWGTVYIGDVQLKLCFREPSEVGTGNFPSNNLNWNLVLVDVDGPVVLSSGSPSVSTNR